MQEQIRPTSATDPVTACLALAQVVGVEALHARVPAALARGLAMVEAAAARAAAETRGVRVPCSAQGIVAWFEDPLDAVRFAMRLQTDLLGLDWPPTLLVRPEAAEERGPDGRLLFRGLRVRIAVHRGQVLREQDGAVSGPAVYQVARVATATSGGQVVVSDAAWRRLRGAFPVASVVRDLGSHALTGVDGESRLLQILPEGLDRRVFPEIAAQDVRRSNLAAPDDALVGRQGDLTALGELVAMGVRLVTVLGPAGVGRSRLCRQFARGRLADGPPAGGVWLCRPSEPTLAGLVRAISQAIGVPLDESPSPVDAVERIAHAFGARGDLLLVVDGISAGEAVAAAVEGWLRRAPRLVLVVNADRRLGVRGEIAYAVAPLPLPAADAARHADAVRLYAARARAIDEDFVFEDLAVVAEIVERVGGLPQAIRLLAGVVDRLPPAAQVERLRAGDLHPDRLVASILELLDPEERRVLAACSALPGSFETVALDEPGVEPVIERLERRGLVRPAGDAAAPGIGRRLVDEPVRAFALQVVPLEERTALTERRAARLVRMLEPWAARAQVRDRAEVVARLAVEWDGLVEAIRIGTEPRREDPEGVDLAMRVALVCRPMLEARGPLFVVLELLERVLKRSDAVLGADPLLQLRLVAFRAACLRRAGRFQPALADLDRAGTIAERWSDREGLALCLVERGRSLLDAGAIDGAVKALTAAEAAWRELGDPVGEATAATHLARGHMAVGRYGDAEQRLAGAVARLREHDVRFVEGQALTFLGLLHRRTGRFEEARSLYREAIRILQECGVPGDESRARADLGLLDLHAGRFEDAEAALALAIATARHAGDRAAEGVVLRTRGLVALQKGDVERARSDLVVAMAIHRDRGDRAAEGIDCGSLAWIHHTAGQTDAAREAYRRALELLGESGERRLEALYTAWLAALEAEAGDASTARALFDVACLKHADSGDPQVGETIEQLRGAVDLMEARLANDPGEAERWRRAAAERHGAVAGRPLPLPGAARLAHARVGRLLQGA